MRIAFRWPEDLPAPRPGQFFTFRPPRMGAEGQGLLRRPLAFSDFDGDCAHAVYQVRGHATGELGLLGPGSGIDIIGPLGNGFSPLPAGVHALIAGGGIGVGPVLFLAASLRAQGLVTGRDFSLALGFRNAASVPSFPEGAMRDLMAASAIRTDDGGAGIRGTALDGIADAFAALPAGRAASARVLACGPGRMLAAISAWAAERGLAAELSAEQWMACGVGACYGCVLPARAGGYLRACADGPVFAPEALAWKE
jgi:dihydroorotate dehydrogenase electron transfer subunit